jgi:hypothetical protein
MVGIVQTDRDEFADTRNRHAKARLAGDERKRGCSDRSDLLER